MQYHRGRGLFILRDYTQRVHTRRGAAAVDDGNVDDGTAGGDSLAGYFQRDVPDVSRLTVTAAELPSSAKRRYGFRLR